jgi:hypothetical protein
MQKFLYFIVLAAVASTLTSCEKPKLENCPGNCTTITGRLLTSGQQGLPGAIIDLYWINGTGYSSTQRHYKGKTITDNNGNYQLTFYVKDDEMQAGYYDVSASVNKTDYYVIGDGIGAFFNGLKRDTSYQLPPYLIPRKAMVDLTVPNANQIQGYFSVDFVSAQGTNLTVDKNSIGGGTVVGVPKQADAFVTSVEVAADQKMYLKTTRSIGNTYAHTVDSLLIPAGTTRNITVTY